MLPSLQENHIDIIHIAYLYLYTIVPHMRSVHMMHKKENLICYVKTLYYNILGTISLL